MNKYEETLRKLYIKGVIDKESFMHKMKENDQKKYTKFEENVNRAIIETTDDGYVKKTVERIFKEKRK